MLNRLQPSIRLAQLSKSFEVTEYFCTFDHAAASVSETYCRFLRIILATVRRRSGATIAFRRCSRRALMADDRTIESILTSPGNALAAEQCGLTRSERSGLLPVTACRHLRERSWDRSGAYRTAA
jgi:hypothetical protein